MTNCNENRPGYKHTKSGWIPEDWECMPLGMAMKFHSGGTPSKANKAYWGGAIPWITAKDLKTPVLCASQESVTLLGAENGTRLMPANTLFILVRGMTLLKDVPVALSSCPMTFNQDIKALAPKNGFGGLFFLYLLSARKQQLRGLVDHAGHGTGRLPTDRLASIPVPIPPLAEQGRIAEVLSAWDREIALADRLIEAKQHLKQGLMQQLLTGRIRFPQFSSRRKQKYIETEAGSIPHDWQCLPGKKVFKNSTEKGQQGLPLLAVTIDSGIVARDSLDRKMPNSIPPEQSLLVRRGDIAYNMMRAWQGAIALVPVDGIVSPAYVVLRTKGSADPLFMHYLFRSHVYQHLITSYSYGLTDDRLRLYYKDFGLLPIILPPLEEQKHIAATLDACDREIQLLVQKRDHLQEQKKGLMQKLLTGEVRVKLLDEVPCND